MIDTNNLRRYSRYVTDLDGERPRDLNPEDYEFLGALLMDAAAELDAARNDNLVRYRAAALGKLAGTFLDDGGKTGAERCAKSVEAYAQAMLAAETGGAC